jgi:hypothetical protein
VGLLELLYEGVDLFLVFWRHGRSLFIPEGREYGTRYHEKQGGLYQATHNGTRKQPGKLLARPATQRKNTPKEHRQHNVEHVESLRYGANVFHGA